MTAIAARNITESTRTPISINWPMVSLITFYAFCLFALIHGTGGSLQDGSELFVLGP